jgi:type IV pilus assembly protein PilY1
MLLFGTGKYLEAADSIAPYQTQSFYGIWDKNDAPGKISGQTKVAGNSKLFRQLITTSGGSGGATYRVLTPEKGTVPDWSTNMGWFMDFPNSSATGERSVFDPLLVAGRLIFTTLIPSGGACEFGGTSFVMVVNPATGGRFDSAVLDVDGDGKITAVDTLAGGVYASGVQSAVGITPTPTVIGSRAGGTSSSTLVTADGTTLVRNRASVRGNMIFGGSGGNGEAVTLPIGLAKEYGRVSWREVLKK